MMVAFAGLGFAGNRRSRDECPGARQPNLTLAMVGSLSAEDFAAFAIKDA
jgi:hypothetical protein